MSKTILITGATGFVGQSLVPWLKERGYDLRLPGRAETGDIDGGTDWLPYLTGVDAVIHLAGRAHVMQESQANPIDLYRAVNRDGTVNLARQAEAAGVKRFVFMSSVKVMGEASDHPLTSRDKPRPCDPYGVSKIEAEDALRQLDGDMAIVTLRPPLVYGPGVKGNFLTLLKIARKAWPLPLASIRNRRSLIYVGNLCSAIEAALTCPPGAYLPCDGEDLSTPGLIRHLSDAMDLKARLWPVPVVTLELAGRLTGKSAMIQRLTGSLTVDGTIPGWTAPFSVREGLNATADWFRSLPSNRL